MGQGLSFEEKSELAKEFIKGIKIGTKVILEAETDNPADENAVMVFMDDTFRGRIAREQCLEVRQLMDENMQADAVVTRNDEELAFFITIPGAAEMKMQPQMIERILPESPLGTNVKMPFMIEEKTLDMLAKRLVGMEITKDTIADFIEKAEHYQPLSDFTICYSDELRFSAIFDKVNWIRRNKTQLELSEANLTRIQNLHEKLHTKVRTMRRSWNKAIEKTFINHLNKLRANEENTQILYKKYCEAFLDSKPFADADQEKMRQERDRLLKWFAEMEWSELKDPKQLGKMASKLAYLRVSRTEIYDVYKAVLLLEQLDKHLPDNMPAESTSASSTSAKKKTKKTAKPKNQQPMTLKYFKHDDKGELKKMKKRVSIVFKLFNHWGWISKDTKSADFESFFEGKPRNCNISWTGGNTVLTILLQELLKQPYIEKQKGCAAKSMVEQQFGKTANSDRKRLGSEDETRIELTMMVLNLENPLPEPDNRRNSRYDYDDGLDNDVEVMDIKEAALMEIYSGMLRSTKGI